MDAIQTVIFTISQSASRKSKWQPSWRGGNIDDWRFYLFCTTLQLYRRVKSALLWNIVVTCGVVLPTVLFLLLTPSKVSKYVNLTWVNNKLPMAIFLEGPTFIQFIQVLVYYEHLSVLTKIRSSRQPTKFYSEARLEYRTFCAQARCSTTTPSVLLSSCPTYFKGLVGPVLYSPLQPLSLSSS